MNHTWLTHFLENHPEMAEMAMTPSSERETGATAGQTVEIAPPLDFDPTHMEARYDHDSDTLFIHFYGEARSAVSIDMNDGLYLRWDRAAEKLVGLQVEDFLSVLAPQHPELLEFADLLEIDPKRVAKIRRRLSPETRKRAAWEVL